MASHVELPSFRSELDYFSLNPLPVFILLEDCSVQYQNPAAEKWLQGRKAAAWENDFRQMCRTAISVFNSGQPLEIQVGEPGDIVNFTAVPERESRSVCFLAAAPEAPARSAIPSLRDEDGGFRDLVEESQQGILIHRNWRPVFGNQALARIFGFSDVDEILKLKSVRELYAMHEHERLKLFNEARFAGNAAPEIYEFEAVRADGEQIWVQTSVRVVTWNGERATQHWLTDVTERKLAEQRLARLASYDVLTGLANRTMFQSELRQAIAQVGRSGGTGALLLLDLENFKHVNDSLGHPAGDALLKRVAQRLVSRARETDFVARLGGDEFAIVANNLTDANGATVIAQTVEEALRQSINLEGTEIFTTASVGITLFPEDSGDPDILLKNADMALYQAKNVGRGKFSFYNAELNAKALRRKELEYALRTAISDDGLQLKYQPKVDIAAGKIVGVEELLRWTHEKHGEISRPNSFLSRKLLD